MPTTTTHGLRYAPFKGRTLPRTRNPRLGVIRMTDPTAPVTPRTEAGRDWLRWKYGGRTTGRDYDEDLTRILAIEREAGSTDALRMDDDHEPHPCCRHPRCCPHALAASDAGPATRSYIGRVRDTEERLIAESLRTDAGPAGIDVERLARALALVHVTDHPIHEAVEHWESYRTDATELIAAYGAVGDLPEYDRLSRESDR
jgi:hypothetical protein